MANIRAAHRLAAALACAAAFHACAQATEVAPRPKVALVLSGGGARGLAHIGVLKALRDQRIPVDFVVATSMGAIVGGAYAAGRTPEELEAVLRSVDWELMFSDRPPREDLSFRRKEDDQRLIGKTELGVSREGVVLPRAAFGSQNLEEFLREVSRHAGDVRTLRELPLPFHPVATDLATGEQVLVDAPLVIAMRASMSIPGVFSPTQVAGRLLGDGGLTRNLPVEVARELGAEVIIAVNVGTPLLPRSALSSALGIAQQMINILTEQNVAISIAQLRPGDVLISPDLSGVTFVDFERGEELIARGEAAGRAAAARLAKLAASPAQYALWESHRTRRPAIVQRPVDLVRVIGALRTNPEALKREVRDRTGIEAGGLASVEQLLKAGRILYGLGDFERVDVREQDEAGQRVVVIDVDEKPWGPNYLRFGGQAVSDFRSEGHFSFIVQHTRTWLNSWGAEWRNELQIGDVNRLATSLFQPLAPGSPWFLEGSAEYAKSHADVFANEFRRTDRVTTSTSTALAVLGRRLGNTAVARAGFGHQSYVARPLISENADTTLRDGADFALVGMNLDTLDDTNFPRRGYLLGAAATRYWYDSTSSPVRTYVAEGLLPITWDRFTLLGIGSAGHSSGGRGGFGLGGFLGLSGTPLGAITGPRLEGASLLGYYRMGELPRGYGRGWYAGASLEAWSVGSWRKAASMFLGLDTLIGPLYIGAGHTFGGQSSFYLFLGRPTSRTQRDF
jgi:NTE family protein